MCLCFVYYFGFPFTFCCRHFTVIWILIYCSFHCIDWFKNLHLFCSQHMDFTNSMAVNCFVWHKFNEEILSRSIFSLRFFYCRCRFHCGEFDICIEYLIRICINSVFFSSDSPAVQFQFDNGVFFLSAFAYEMRWFFFVRHDSEGKNIFNEFILPHMWICTDCMHECGWNVNGEHKSRNH